MAFRGPEKYKVFFFNLEKNKSKNSTTLATKLHNGQVNKSPKKILKVQRDFYGKLYSRDADVSFNYFNDQAPQLNVTQKTQMDGAIMMHEMSIALKEMKWNNGLSADFYKVFYKEIKNVLFEALNYAIQVGRFHTTSRRGVIHLILKKDRELLMVKNWRLITLLCVDYKVFSKILAN